jgi:hypothetical protein
MEFLPHLSSVNSDIYKILSQKIKFTENSSICRKHNIFGWFDIDLAGLKNRFLVNYTFTSGINKTFHLKGTQNINFSDFNLTPPRKLGGMIRANERLDVEFQLDLAAIQ